jgi:succinate dehydrogenase / fumarate reductase, iron-sulfur subunit
MEVRFKILRYNPELDAAPHYQDYVITAQPQERILDCLNRIKWELDGTLSYRMSCGHGVCGSDGMKINGRCALACQKLVKDYLGAEVVLEPLPQFPVLKDLVVDMDGFLNRVGRIRPYIVNASAAPEHERLQSPADHKKLDTVIRCILCACCTAACPVTGENPGYVGPASLVWALRFLFDSRDDQFEKRLRAIDFSDGVWACVNHFECTRVCPKEIPITKSINLMKREIETKLRSS